MTGTVTPLHGGPTYERQRVETCVEVLRDMLERAENGEIVGAAVVALSYDGHGEYMIGGRVGGYSMLGAAQIMHTDLTEVARGE